MLAARGFGPIITAKIDLCPCYSVRQVQQYGQARSCLSDRRAA